EARRHLQAHQLRLLLRPGLAPLGPAALGNLTMARIPLSKRVDLTNPPRAPRLLYAGAEWLGETHPHPLIQETSMRMMGTLDEGMTIDPAFGTFIQGPLSMAEMPQNIHMASYWAFNPMLLCSVGSSAAMNIPTLVPAMPPILEAKKALGNIL